MDKKVQMMDAGMAYFHSDKGFGETLGQISAELQEIGTVLIVSDGDGGKFGKTVSLSDLPSSTANCDLFLDFSSPWRKRYISCLLEFAGEGMFAARFKEGDSNGWLKDTFIILVTIASIVASVLLHSCWIAIGCIIASLVVWFWPSVRARKAAGKLISKINSYK